MSKFICGTHIANGYFLCVNKIKLLDIGCESQSQKILYTTHYYYVADREYISLALADLI
jgi:hypothetical protein